MNDKEIRKFKLDTEMALGYITQRLDNSPLKDLSVKGCPKCNHPVVAQTHSRYVSNIICWTDYYQCLTCGSKFTCSEKCVCELIKDAD